MRNILSLLLSFLIGLQTAIPAHAKWGSQSEIPQAMREILAAARTGDEISSENIEDVLEAAHIKRVEEMERDFLETAIEPAKVDEEKVNPRQQLNEMPIENFLSSPPKFLAGLFTKLIIFGRGKKFSNLLLNMMNRISWNGDSQFYTVFVTGSPMPNAAIIPAKAEMFINMGLIGDTANVDELAYVIAHEMTHENQKLLAATEDDKEIEELLDGVNGYSNLDPAQREEIRADLGAIVRVIKGRYNPWAGYNLMKRWAKSNEANLDLAVMRFIYRKIFRRSFEYMEAHPVAEIRMAAMKAYILKKSREMDLSDLTQKYEPYPGVLKTLQLQMAAISKPLFSKWGQRAQQGYLGYSLWNLFMSESIVNHYLEPVTAPIKQAASIAFVPVGWTFSKMGELFSLLFSFLPPDAAREVFSPNNLMLATVGIGFIGIATLIGMATNGLVHLFREDEDYPKYREVFQQLKSYRYQREAINVSAVEKALEGLRMLNRSNNFLKTIYSNYNMVKFTRYTNGITVVMAQSYSLVRENLTDAIEALGTLRGEARRKFVEEYRHEISFIPGFLLDSYRVSKQFRKFVELADEKEIQPCVTSDEFVKALEESDIPKTTAVTVATRDAIDKNSPADLRVSVAYALLKMGARDSAFELIGEYPFQIVDQILNDKNPNPEVTNKLQAILAESRKGGSLRGADYIDRIGKDLYLAAEKLRSRFTGRREALMSMTRPIPAQGLFFGYLKARQKLEQADAKNLENQIAAKFSNVRDVVDYFDKEVAGKGGSLQSMSPVFVGALDQRSDWIHSMDDVDMIISRPEFWPQFSGSLAESSPLERTFIAGIEKLRKKFPAVWKYEPAAAEKMHNAIVKQLKELKIYPATTEGQIELWKKLTTRGVTTVTDSIFHEIYKGANAVQKEELENLALSEGRVWETEIKAEIAERRVFNSEEFKKLLALKGDGRDVELKAVIEEVQRLIPEAGRVYWDLLEKISVQIMSTEKESKFIHESKKLTQGGEKQEDFGLRVLSELTETALNWRRKDQWALIQYLRGRGEVTPKIQQAFNVIGPERMQRIYELLPLIARTELIDAFVDAPRGLLGKFSVDSGWGKTMLEELFDGNKPEEVAIAKELLEAFLHALKKTGNGALRTYVVSYLLSQHKGKADTAEILKNVLEIFGATGVKIGQFLAASGLLPEKETKVLRKLQEKAKVPLREEIYAEVRDVLSKDNVPFRIGNLKGAASIKYAVEAMPEGSAEKAILKIFRLESIAHTRMEFNLLDRMAEFLVKRHGTKYGIFRSVVKASRAAVERELVVPEEIKKSLAAQRYIYINLDEANIRVKAPLEALAADRAILAEYAEGVSFFDLRSDIQAVVARKILQMEGSNLFANKEIVLFDPDRHAGNYRVHVQEYNGVNHLVIEPTEMVDITAIDMGQVLKFKPETRTNIIDLFAYSQVLRKVGATDQIAEYLGRKFSLTEKKQKLLRRTLAMYYPDTGKEITSYFALLASLEAVGVTLDIVYFDFVRAIIQLQQYEPYAPKERDWQTPTEIFTAQVRERANSIRGSIALTNAEKLDFAWVNLEGESLFGKLKSAGSLILNKEKRDAFILKLQNSKTELTAPQSCESLVH